MLHYLTIITYLLAVALLTIILTSKHIISLLIMFESAVALLFLSTVLVGAFYNIYYLSGLALFMLMLGGLELAIALVFFSLNV